MIFRWIPRIPEGWDLMETFSVDSLFMHCLTVGLGTHTQLRLEEASLIMTYPVSLLPIQAVWGIGFL